MYSRQIHNSGISEIDQGSFHLHSRYVVQNLVQPHFDLVSWLQALEKSEPVSEPENQMAVELID